MGNDTTTPATDLGAHYLQEARRGYRALKKDADDAVAQLADEQIWATLDAESNSVGVIMRHVAGNLRSRWTDFLTGDGEKADRNRDGEFEAPADAGRAALAADWEDGWARAAAALAALAPADLLRTVAIRGEPLTVLRAIERNTRHCASHVGQIVYLAKHLRGAEWRTLSIPRGQSQGWRAGGRA
jgi:hypothetical protein